MLHKLTSPCIQVCSVDTNGVCQGCYRSLDQLKTYKKDMTLSAYSISILDSGEVIIQVESAPSSSFKLSEINKQELSQDLVESIAVLIFNYMKHRKPIL